MFYDFLQKCKRWNTVVRHINDTERDGRERQQILEKKNVLLLKWIESQRNIVWSFGHTRIQAPT